MTNWKTTLAGIISGVGFVLTQVPHTGHYGAIVAAVGTVLTGLAAKDNDVTGGTRANTK
jgi:hypothetical protein